jgi:hypothetical protein
MRFLTVYSYAFKISSELWCQIQSAKIDGIRCDGACLPLPYWGLLSTAISNSSISQFSLHLNFLSITREDMSDFESVMQVLSQTVRVASFNVIATNDICQDAFQIIQRSFYRLKSLELSNIAPWNSSWVLQQNWSCIGELENLIIRSSQLSFSLITNFIEYASTVVNLTVKDCVPQDASEGVAFIGLKNERHFNSIDIPNDYREGFYTGSIVIFRYSED